MGNPRKAPFVLRPQGQLEMLKKSDCKSLSVRDMQRVVTFEKHSVNIALHKSPPEGSASEQNIKIFTFGFGAPWMGFMVEIGLGTGIWTPPPPLPFGTLLIYGQWQI